MKEYKLVYLNKGVKLNHEKDLAVAEKEINKWVAEGWTLQQIFTHDAVLGVLVGAFYKET